MAVLYPIYDALLCLFAAKRGIPVSCAEICPLTQPYIEHDFFSSLKNIIFTFQPAKFSS